MKDIRLLKANEIEARVGSINEKGATLLLYKDARVDMNVLDESGLKWKRSHELIDGKLFCTISIWDDEIKEWITRQDVGTESNTEKEKGQASDAFKRAGFNFGIGRELYTAPFIWVSSASYTGFERAGKFGTYDKFSVVSISYNENKEINSLSIKNLKTNKVIFTMGEKVEVPIDSKPEPSKVRKNVSAESFEKLISDEQRQAIAEALGREGIAVQDMPQTLLEQYDVPLNAPISYEKAKEIMADLGVEPF